MPDPLTNAEKRALKARAQHLEPLARLGHQGITAGFVRGLDEALAIHGLVKVRFAAFKDQKKELAPEIAERTGSELIARIGNVAVYFRRQSPPASAALPAAQRTANERE